MFNLLVSADGNAWETDQLMRMASDRFKEYSAGSEAEDICLNDANTLKRLDRIPTFLMYERNSDGPNTDVVRYGHLCDIRSSGTELVFRFVEKGRFQRSVIEEFSGRLGISKYEYTRTHWAIKDGDIPTSMLDKLQNTGSQKAYTTGGLPLINNVISRLLNDETHQKSESLVSTAKKLVPSFRWIIAAAALLSLAAGVISGGRNLGTLFLVGGVLLVAAVALIALQWIWRLNKKTASALAAFLAWSFLLLLVAALVLVLFSAVDDKPWPLRTLINQYVLPTSSPGTAADRDSHSRPLPSASPLSSVGPINRASPVERKSIVEPTPWVVAAAKTDTERIEFVHELQIGTDRTYIEHTLGPPKVILETEIPDRTAVEYDFSSLRLLMLYNTKNQLVLVGVHPLTAKARQSLDLPKPHVAVEMDFKATKFSKLDPIPKLPPTEHADFDYLTAAEVVIVSTRRDHRYAEYRHYGGPHFDLCTLGISTGVVVPPDLKNSLSKIRAALRPDIIVYFSYDALWENVDSGSEESGSNPKYYERLERFLSLADDVFQLIEYNPAG